MLGGIVNVTHTWMHCPYMHSLCIQAIYCETILIDIPSPVMVKHWLIIHSTCQATTHCCTGQIITFPVTALQDHAASLTTCSPLKTWLKAECNFSATSLAKSHFIHIWCLSGLKGTTVFLKSWCTSLCCSCLVHSYIWIIPHYMSIQWGRGRVKAFSFMSTRLVNLLGTDQHLHPPEILII